MAFWVYVFYIQLLAALVLLYQMNELKFKTFRLNHSFDLINLPYLFLRKAERITFPDDYRMYVLTKKHDRRA